MKNTDHEYAEFVLKETAQSMIKALAIYAVFLSAYWLTIG